MSGDPSETGNGVRLLNVPLQLLEAAEIQWQGLLREYLLRGFGGGVQAYGPPEVERAGRALDAVMQSVRRLPGTAGEYADVTVDLTAANAADFALLQSVLDDAARLATSGELLLLPSLPEVRALRNWFCAEALAQAAGAPPTRWELRHEVAEGAPSTAADWDPSIVPADDSCWLLGDDRNRIVAASRPALDLLGWTEEQLVGQRVLAVIPPTYREAHLAAFTRNVVDGRSRILGQRVGLSALTADGRELPITLTLTKHRSTGGRAMFLGVIEPADER
jgi:PAS domain S-box-containing protein